MIASEMFGYPYEECLEFYPEGTELEIDGQKVIAGSGKEEQVEVDDKEGITTFYYNLLETDHGDISAQDLKIGNKVKADTGWLTLIDKQIVDEKNIKLIFKNC